MKPFYHIVLTITVFFIAKIFVDVGFNVLILALLLTVIVDIVDHSLLILSIKNSFMNKVRKLLYKLKIREAYNLYYKERYKTGKAFLHNLAFFIIVTLVGIIYKNPVILLGISFHFICDMLSDIYFLKRLNDNWTFAFLFKKKR